MNSNLILGLGLSFLLVPMVTLAQLSNFVPLVGIPGITDNGLTIGSYINALYALSISVAALLAVIKIIIAGMKWMLSDVVTNKSEAISDIKGAIFGLVVVISAVLILEVINPQLRETNIFLEPVRDTVRATGTNGAGNAIPLTGTGYQALDLRNASQETIAAFSTACQAQAGSIYRVEGAGTAVCYAPLPSDITSYVRNEFIGLSNIPDIQRRFQTTHYPRMITAAGIKESIRQDENAAEVLLAVQISPQNDWLDSANRTAMNTTCRNLQQASDQPVSYVTGTVNGTAYVACVRPPQAIAPVTPEG